MKNLIRDKEWFEKRQTFLDTGTAHIRTMNNVCMLAWQGDLDDVDLYEIITAIMGGIEDDERYALVWTMLADAAGQLNFMNGEE